VEGFSTTHPANWGALLASLEGEPPRVVCDAHQGMIQAISERWPDAELHQCEWHLQHALRRLLRKEVRKGSGPELEELYERAEGRSQGQASESRSPGGQGRWHESLDRWIAVNGPTIEAQFARRPPPSRRPVEMLLTTSAHSSRGRLPQLSTRAATRSRTAGGSIAC
jgi:hypothetical protein